MARKKKAVIRLPGGSHFLEPYHQMPTEQPSINRIFILSKGIQTRKKSLIFAGSVAGVIAAPNMMISKTTACQKILWQAVCFGADRIHTVEIAATMTRLGLCSMPPPIGWSA